MHRLNEPVMENIAKVMSYIGTKKKETKKADKRKRERKKESD
jgi:hypothetical protein